MSKKRSQRNNKKYLTALRKKRAKFHSGSHSKPAGKSWKPHDPNKAGHNDGTQSTVASGADQGGMSVFTGSSETNNDSNVQNTAAEETATKSVSSEPTAEQTTIMDTFIEENINPQKQESFRNLPFEEQEKYREGMSTRPQRPDIPNAKQSVDELTKRFEQFKKTATDEEILDFFETGEDEIQKLATDKERAEVGTVGADVGKVEGAEGARATTVDQPKEKLETTTVEAELSKEIVDDVGPPQGSAVKVLEQVDTKNIKSSAEAGKDLEGSGVDSELSNSIANDPEGALDQLDGADIESRSNIADLPEEALMSAQMNGLLAGMEEGKTPLWAKPAVDKVNAMLAARGLTASSIGQGALFNAIIQSAMPIAQENARALQERAAQKLDAAVKFRTQEAAFEQEMEIANLSNRQQAYLTKLKFKQENMLSDQAAQNAAKQFNATSENQTKQFMASLENNINQFNAAAENAMKTFNISEKNKLEAINAGNELAVAQFNAQQKNDMAKFYEQNDLVREQFNATNAQAIEQSNTAWRRSTNTAATAAINAANQQNVQNAFNMTTLEQTMVWQQLRDTATYIRDAYERSEDRKTTLFNTVMGNKNLMDNKYNSSDSDIMSHWTEWLSKNF